MSQLLVVATLAGRRIALRAGDVQSVIALDALTPVPCAPPHVAGLAGLRSRVLTAIDGRRALGLGDGDPPGPGTPAAVVLHEGHSYALLLDQVEDVTQAWSAPEPVRARMEGNWAAMTHGLAETAIGPLLVIDVAAIVAPRPAEAACATIGNEHSVMNRPV